MSDDETVADVLIDACPDTGAEAMIDMTLGDKDPSSLSYEDWVKPLKLTGGQVCLRIERDPATPKHWPDWYVKRDNAGMLEATDGSDGWMMHARELRAILGGDAGSEGRVQPVLREDTPFGGNDEG